jgi:hypothetical protein
MTQVLESPPVDASLTAVILASALIATARRNGADDATIHAAAVEIERISRVPAAVGTHVGSAALSAALDHYNAADASLADVKAIRDSWGREVLRLLRVESRYTTLRFDGASRRFRAGSLISRIVKRREKRAAA